MPKRLSDDPTAAASPTVHRAHTIRDVAREAGVCIGTVSRVINNKDRVDPITRSRIQGVIHRLGYHPSALARSLVLRRSQTILVAVPDTTDPFFTHLLQEISNRCYERSFGALLGDACWSAERQADYIRRLHDGRVDGAIISPMPPADDQAAVSGLIHARFPIVLMHNAMPGIAAPLVRMDDHASATMAMEYLLARGHRRIGLISNRSAFDSVRDRTAAWREALLACGVADPERCLLMLSDHLEAGFPDQQLAQLMRQPDAPTAFLAINEVLAIAGINALRRIGYEVPRDIAIIAITDVEVSPLVPMGITAVAVSTADAAAAAVDLLLAQIAAPDQDRPDSTVVIPHRLVVRQSA